MNLITPDSGLLFWMVLIFGIVLFILAKWGFPAITSAVDERSKKIADSLEQARAVEKRVAEIAEEHEQMIAAAKKEQAQIIKEAASARDAILAKARADAAEETSRMIAHAQMQIEADRLTAEAGLRKQVAVLSVQVAEKVLRKNLSAVAEQAALIDKLVDEAAKAPKIEN